MTLRLAPMPAFSRAEALAELAGYLGDEIITPTHARRIAAPFGARPIILPPDDEIGERHVLIRHLADAIVEAEGVTVPWSWGDKRFLRDALEALRGAGHGAESDFPAPGSTIATGDDR